MEYYFEVRPPLVIWRRGCVVMGSLEFFTSFATLIVYIYWFNIPTVYAFIILFQIFHLFSWLATLIIGAGSISIPYVTFAFVIYALSLVFDLASLIWRIVLYVDCLVGSCDVNSGYAITELFLTSAFIGIDVIILVVLVFTLAGVRDHVERAKVLLQGLAGSKAMSDRFYQVSKAVYYLRTILGVAWQFDFWISLGTEVVIVFGIGLSASFIYTGLFVLPHTFMWLIARAVSGSPILIPSDAMQDTELMFSVALVYLVVIVIDVAGVGYTGWEVSQCSSNMSSCNNVSLGLGYLVLFLYLVLLVVIVFETVVIFIIQNDYSKSQRFVIFPNVTKLLEREEFLPIADIARSNRSDKFNNNPEEWQKIKAKYSAILSSSSKTSFTGLVKWFISKISTIQQNKKNKKKKKVKKSE